MKPLLLLTTALLTGCAGLSPEEQKFVDEVLEVEAKGGWKRVAWEPDFEAARARATAEGRPILVFFIVGAKGEKNAEHC